MESQEKEFLKPSDCLDLTQYRFETATCPCCKCVTLIGMDEMALLIKQGKADPGTMGAITVEQGIISDPHKALVSVLGTTTVLDGCARCGCAFIRHHSVANLPLSSLQQGGPR